MSVQRGHAETIPATAGRFSGGDRSEPDNSGTLPSPTPNTPLISQS